MTSQNPVVQQPANTDLLRLVNYRMMITRMPEVVYTCQKVNIPGMTLPNIPVHTWFSAMQIPSDVLQFEPLSVSFPVDEELNNWKEIKNWMFGLGFPDKFKRFNDLMASDFKEYSTITVAILSNHMNPIAEITYYDCFPTSLSSIQFDSTTTDSAIPIEANVEFSYTYYDFK